MCELLVVERGLFVASSVGEVEIEAAFAPC